MTHLQSFILIQKELRILPECQISKTTLTYSIKLLIKQRCQLIIYNIYIDMQHLKKFIEPLQLTILDKLPALKFIEEQYKVKPSIVAIAVFVLLLLLSPLLHTHSLLTSLVCYLIPAYLSFLALQTTDKEDDIRYLNYWIVFSLAELLTPFLRLFFNNFFYMIFRMVVTLLLLHPITNLSVKFYNNMVRPFLLRYEKDIDSNIDNLAKQGKKKVLEEISEGIKKLD